MICVRHLGQKLSLESLTCKKQLDLPNMLFSYVEMFSQFVFITSRKLSKHSAIVGRVIAGDVTNLCGNKNFRTQLDLWMDILSEQYQDEDKS
jgi:hypothetical protein